MMTGALQIYIGKAIQYSEEHGTDKAVVMTIAGATNSKIDYSAFEKGDCIGERKEGQSRGKGRGQSRGDY